MHTHTYTERERERERGDREKEEGSVTGRLGGSVGKGQSHLNVKQPLMATVSEESPPH